ncbi:biosynthetic-type acetolactate synthase large subunit [Candidatus Woesearchaeota archaeon]|nr:biosynthetic-type acetolactate synthase large subunit [Candidatus Woesearchaeota archaeon]
MKNNSKTSTAKIIVDTLIENNVKTIFGYPGAAVIPIFDELLENREKIHHVLVRHEQAAVHMADSYARITGKPGVCIATSGPGATNLITGIANAHLDSVPLIAIAGQVPTNKIASDAFQESDMMGITLPITKHNFQIRKPEDAKEIILKAIKIANQGRPGPVYIDIPVDMQKAKINPPKKNHTKIPGFNTVTKGNAKQIKLAADLIRKAKKPVFFIGGGVIKSNASSELKKIVDITKIPVVTTLMGKSAYPEDDDLCLGMVGMQGRKCANFAVQKSDLLIITGSRLSDRSVGKFNEFSAGSKKIHIDIDPAEIGKNISIDVPIVGDAKSVLEDLYYELSKNTFPKNNSSWKESMIRLNKECCCSLNISSEKISAKKVIYELEKIITEKDIIVTGVGQHQIFAAHFLKTKKPGTFITSGGLGTMGYGLPAAIGAKIGSPEKRVFLLDGDGSFQMTAQELATIKQEKIKIIPIIFNNSYLGMVAQWLRLFKNNRMSNVYLGKNPDFVKLAESFSLKGIRVDDPEKIRDAIQKSIESAGTMIVEIEVDPEENILPMISSGNSLDKLFGPCITDNYFKQ